MKLFVFVAFAVKKHDKPAIILEQNLEKRFGTSQILTASIFEEDGGRELANLDPASLLKEAIHVISCGYEDKTDWGKEVAAPKSLSFLCNKPKLKYLILSRSSSSFIDPIGKL